MIYIFDFSFIEIAPPKIGRPRSLVPSKEALRNFLTSAGGRRVRRIFPSCIKVVKVGNPLTNPFSCVNRQKSSYNKQKKVSVDGFWQKIFFGWKWPETWNKQKKVDHPLDPLPRTYNFQTIFWRFLCEKEIVKQFVLRVWRRHVTTHTSTRNTSYWLVKSLAFLSKFVKDFLEFT